MSNVAFLGRLFICACLLTITARADDLDRLATDFWTWRVVHQPFSDDDIPRIERPVGAPQDWSANAIAHQREELSTFESRWKRIDTSGWTIPRQVDYRLMGSALARVRWELDVLRSWQRNPEFYVDQTLGAVMEALLPPPPFPEPRAREIRARIDRIPQLIEQAKANLTDMRAPFAAAAIDVLRDIQPRLATVARELKPFVQVDTSRAGASLEGFRSWLEQKLPRLPQETAVGRDNYVFFLQKVALLPFTPEQLLDAARQERARTKSFQMFEQSRGRSSREPTVNADTTAEQRSAQEEERIRRFLESHNLLTVPPWLRHYRRPPLPAYLVPFADYNDDWADDLTGPSRLYDDAVGYIHAPSPDKGFSVQGIVHEGVPGHYMQLCLAWRHDDPIRRHFYDSGPNEGIAVYAEEMMLQAGLSEESPQLRKEIQDAPAHHANLVETDVNLALGRFSVDQAAEHWARVEGAPVAAARRLVTEPAGAPGQWISYQTGKLQILRLLEDAQRAQGDGFSLRAFHDFVWKNGNVPLSLQRWELLNDPSELPQK